MKFAYFDMETALYTGEQVALVESGEKLQSIWDIWPFGVSVAAIKLSDHETPEVWYELLEGQPAPFWSTEYTRRFIFRLEELDRQGYTLVTWNGAGFDFRVLYLISKDPVVIELCMRSIDPCFQMVCMTGYPVGLEAAAVRAGAPSKEEDGISAPVLWYEGEYERVIRYVIGDVLRLEVVLKSIAKDGGITWKTKKGGLSFRHFPNLFTVAMCAELPPPERFILDKEEMISWSKT